MALNDVLFFTALAVAAWFALLMLYKGLFPKRDLVEYPSSRGAKAFWFVFQGAIIGWAFWFNQQQPQPVQPLAVMIFGGAIAYYLTFVLTILLDYGRRLLTLLGLRSRSIIETETGELPKF